MSEFPKDRTSSDSFDVYCRLCTQQRMRAKRARYVEAGWCADCGATREGSRSRRFCIRCAKFYSTRNTAQSRALRARVIYGYGGAQPACRCCGESEPRFLTLDHVNNGGRAHRIAKGAQGVLRELERTGFPAGFQVLCFNCNLARGAYGICPHEGVPLAKASPIVARASFRASCARRCTRCSRDLPLCAFYPSKLGRDGVQSRCRVCTREESTARLRTARSEAFAHYASGIVACACCGEHEAGFLALDHIDGKGPRQPGRRAGGNSFYSWLKKQGFPTGLQVLCHNCNCAKGRDRQCPHRITRGSVVAAA
jgi:hypothetical protein